MFCPKCGTELPDGSQFCLKCGASLVANNPQKPKSWGRTKGLLALLAVVFLVYVAWQSFSSQTQPRTETIVNTAFTVKAGNSYYYKFEVPSGAQSVLLDGHFTASGGSGDDIEVFLLNEDGFVNWQNGHKTTTLYNSGRVTQNGIKVQLPSSTGIYYLVFDNSFSIRTPKAIEANVKMNYLL